VPRDALPLRAPRRVSRHDRIASPRVPAGRGACPAMRCRCGPRVVLPAAPRRVARRSRMACPATAVRAWQASGGVAWQVSEGVPPAEPRTPSETRVTPSEPRVTPSEPRVTPSETRVTPSEPRATPPAGQACATWHAPRAPGGYAGAPTGGHAGAPPGRHGPAPAPAWSTWGRPSQGASVTVPGWPRIGTGRRQRVPGRAQPGRCRGARRGHLAGQPGVAGR
jgi:hypothetical protein